MLFFFDGTHPDYHQATDSPDKVDAEKEARIVRLVYFLGTEIGNADDRPQWSAVSFKKIVEKKYQRCTAEAGRTGEKPVRKLAWRSYRVLRRETGATDLVLVA